MDIDRIQNAIDYIEANLDRQIDFSVLYKITLISKTQFEKVFALLTGYSLGEYIRMRRLTEAGIELKSTNCRVLDMALKYGYESPESFTRAFQKFHGLSPSTVRLKNASLQQFQPMSLSLSMEGGQILTPRKEWLDQLVLTGFIEHFYGSPDGDERFKQEDELFISTREYQWTLKGAAGYAQKDEYSVLMNVQPDGYDFFLGRILSKWTQKKMINAGTRFVNIVVPKGWYYVVYVIKNKTDDIISQYINARKCIKECLFKEHISIREAPELVIYHWEPKIERCIKLMIPIQG